MLALPPIPKNITIRQSGIPNTNDPIEFVQAFFLSVKPVYKTSTRTWPSCIRAYALAKR